MSLLHDFLRVNRGCRCPVCERADWCLVSRDDPDNPARVVCARVPSARRYGDAGWLHLLRDDGARARQGRTRVLRLPQSIVDFERLAQDLVAAVDFDLLHEFAGDLGVSTESLQRLGIGLARGDDLGQVGLKWGHAAWVFPMTGDDGQVCGLRLRLPGRKLAVKGSKNGLFVPTDLPDHPDILFVSEGESDAAALLSIGLDAIGRPSCRGGKKLIARFVRDRRPGRVVVVADADHPGARGAGELADRLRSHCRDVRVVTPPAADAREWIRGGARGADVMSAADRARPRRLVVSVDRRCRS